MFDGDLSQYDAFFFFTTGNLTDAGTDNAPAMSARGKEALLAAIRNGKGFVGVHSASATFHSKGEPYETQQQLDPYIAMLGGEFLSHGSQQEGRVKVVDTSFPGLQGWAETFTIKEEWYSLKNFSKDIHVLLVLDTDGMHDFDYRRPPYPIAWVRKEGRGPSLLQCDGTSGRRVDERALSADARWSGSLGHRRGGRRGGSKPIQSRARGGRPSKKLGRAKNDRH